MEQQTAGSYLLVSYSWGRFGPAKNEVIRTLRTFGDPEPQVRKSAVAGIAVVHTCLDNREVIRRCHELLETQPLDAFAFAIKWVPVDHWCATGLDSIKRLIDERVAPRIAAGQRWGMKVYKRTWQQHHTREIVEHLAADIDRPVDLDRPDWILWVDILGRETAVSLLRPEEIFTLGLHHP
jgi:tRNA acetyltransferase TAN1